MKSKPAQNFQDLIVWQKAHRFVLDTYSFTSHFPRIEMWGLTSQFRRAAISIAANIAEGFKKTGKGDKIRFLNISQGSLEECRYYILLARDLSYGYDQTLYSGIEDVSKLLQAYTGSIRDSLARERLATIVSAVFLLFPVFGILYSIL